jgi:LAO/AO transport system kinase
VSRRTASSADELVAGVEARQPRALARSISAVEGGGELRRELIRRLYPATGRARVVGVTGPPGAGKSTLVNELARIVRTQDRTVGILAVDPTSPFSGGALLGDRIRMEERTLDAGVFIRSMASRDSHGGLARATVDACDVMDAFGFDLVLVETVGVGQAEYDVVSAADTVLVVLCPGAGDGIQAMKSGLLEVADVLVVNKADLAGADRLVCDLEEAVHIRQAGRSAWQTPVVTCSAGEGRDVESVLEAVAAHRAWLQDGRLDDVRSEKRVQQVKRVLSERLLEHVWDAGGATRRVRALIAAGEPPYDVAAKLYAELCGNFPVPPTADEARA